MPYMIGSQPCIRLVHIAGDDRHVLKPAVVSSRIGGERLAGTVQILSKLDLLLAKLHPSYAYVTVRAPSLHLCIGHLHEIEHPRVKGDRAIHICDGEADRLHASDARDLRHCARRDQQHESEIPPGTKSCLHARTPALISAARTLTSTSFSSARCTDL